MPSTNPISKAVYFKLPFVLYYQGDYRTSPVFSLITIIENNLGGFYKKGMVRKLTYLAVEALQNIERYSQHNQSYNLDFALIYSDGNQFHILTQNLILNSDIEKLKSRIDEVNSKHKEDLNELFISQLDSEEGTTKGAGLGLIDMARKSNRPLAYEFNQLTEEYSTYRLHIAYNLTEEVVPKGVAPQDLLDALNSVSQEIKSSLCYIGDFSNLFLQELLKMLKETKKGDAISANTKFHHVLIEFTQNVKRHGKKIGEQIPACLSIHWMEKRVVVSVQNLSTRENLSHVRTKIERLNNSNEQELTEISKDVLNDFDNPGGLGLVDVAVISRPNKIECESFLIPDMGEGVELKTVLNYV